MRVILPLLLLAAGSITIATPTAEAEQVAASRHGQRNIEDFDFVTSKIASNYGGWDTKVTPATRPKLDALTADLRAKAANASDDQLLAILQQWIGFFKDGHTRIFPAAIASAPSGPAASVARDYPTMAWSEQYVRSRLRAAGSRRDPIEGIWSIDGTRYRLGILRTGSNRRQYKAVVLATTAEGWKPGQIKAELSRRPDGGLDVTYRAGDHSEAKLVSRLVAGNAALDTGQWGFWLREWPSRADPDKMSRLFPLGELFLKRLSAKTLWLRIPDFGESRAKPLRDLIAMHRKALESTPNLLIDLRNNGGGSDFVYAPLIPLLYTRPIMIVGVELRASADNIALRHVVAERIKAEAPDAAADIEQQNKLMQQHLGEYVQANPRPLVFDREDAILPYPRHIAVLIDKAGSTAEQFLLEARESHKVTLFGQRNSAGVLDFANVVSMPTPSGRYEVQWATSRSMRVPDDPVDPDGIAPDVRIPARVKDPVTFAADWLERQVD